MRRKSYLPYILFALVLFSVFHFPERASGALRYKTVEAIGASWQNASFFRGLLFRVPTLKGTEEIHSENPCLLEMENHNLKAQLDALQEWLLFDGRVEDEVQRLKSLRTTKVDDLYWKDFFTRRSEEVSSLLERQLQAVPARVVYREPTSWSSSLWVDVGEKDNEKLSRQIVAVNSPVLIGNKLVGIVEEVCQTRSRIRLLTDSGLVPSVRALRGNRQDAELKSQLQALINRVQIRNDLFSHKEERDIFLKVLAQMKERLSRVDEDNYLAKGELMGSSSPLWRCRNPILRGKGFNYDYSDQEGDGRDLRTGVSLRGNGPALPLLKVGDLLVTTGMDGFFPPGLEVAVVTKIEDLKPGAYAYDLEARPVVENFNDLHLVYVLPPL